MHPELCRLALEAINGTECHSVKEMGNTFYEGQRATRGSGIEFQHQNPKTATVWLPQPVRELIATAQAQLGYSAPQWDRINIIDREYRRGGRLKPHLDRVHIFDEKIFNCVLENTSDSQLVLHPPQGSNEADLIMQEETGRCVGMTDAARHRWMHGVPPIGSGTRGSLSWRYLIEDAMTDTGHPDTEPQSVQLPELERPRKHLKQPKIPDASKPLVIILSLCDGIGVVPWAAEQLWLGHTAVFSWEILDHAVKVAKTNMPRTTHKGDFLEETDVTLEAFLQVLPDVPILIAAAFPCQDNSDLKKGKKGLQGDKSKLIFDIAKFRKKVTIAKRRLSRTAEIHCLWRHMMGTSDEDVE